MSGTNGVRCQVGFPNAPFIEPQPCRSLCWASSLAYTLQGFGMRMSVDSVLHRMETSDRCTRRDDGAILMGAAGHWIDDTGRVFLVKANRLPDIHPGSFEFDEFQPLVDALRRRPLIVGVPGHTRVLIDMLYIDAPMVHMRQDLMTFRDPWSNTPNRVTETFDAAPERMFVIGLDVRRV